MSLFSQPAHHEQGLQMGLSPGDIRAREAFVKEYLVDYDAYKACLRCGYLEAYAKERSVTYLSDPYVAWLVKESQDKTSEDGDILKNRVIQGLVREANNHGEGSSHSARVTALKVLAEVYGIEAKKSANQNAGGVMVVPAITNVDDWEAAAVGQQEALKNGAT